MRRLSDFKGFLPYIAIVFLNAFVDLGHKIIVQNTVFKVYDGQTQIILTAVVNALILLPFVFLFSPAGFLSDKYPKNRIMRYSAWAAVAITLAITACYYAGWFWGAFGLTFVLAIQSALYSPAKYGYIKEMVGNEPLARANGTVQATTIVAILLGTFVFSGLFEGFLKGTEIGSPDSIVASIAPLGWGLVALSLVELVLAYQLPKQREVAEAATFEPKQYVQLKYLRKNLQSIRSSNTIWQSIIGLATFWAISQGLLAAFPAFAKSTLGETNTLVIQGILACSGIGIIIGSIYASRMSRNYIETGLIPFGAAGIAIALALIPTLETRFAMAAAFLALGIMGGMFMVPLNALIQFHARDNELGTVLAGNNWVQNVAMLSFLVLTAVIAHLGLTSQALFWFLLAVAVIGTGYTVRQLPHSLARALVRSLLKRRYKVEVNGFKHLPAEGAVLLLGNHISWIDWALVQVASARPVRFVMERDIYNLWYLKPIFKLFGVVPISRGRSSDSLATINDLLKAGEVVCLFPEGAISRNGQLGKFHSGYERAVEGVEGGVIIPFYLRGLWGSSFSRSADKLREARAPQGTRRDIIVAFGKPLPISTPAEVLKQNVFELSISAWEQFTDSLDTVPLTWIKTAKRYGNAICAVDTQGDRSSYHRMLAGTFAFAKFMGKQSKLLGGEKNIGLVLPSSSANIMANMAVMLNGQVAVNLNFTASVEAVQAALKNAEIKSIYTSKQFTAKLRQKGLDVDGMFQGVNIFYLEEVMANFSKVQLVLSLVQAKLLPASWLIYLYGKRVSLDSAAAILFSSGSEGAPKGIVLSHRNIMANCKQISDVLNTQPEDVILGSLPPFHSFGLTVTAIMPALEGLPVVCHPDPTDVVNIAKAVAKHRATILCGTATFLRLYARNSKIEPLMLESLRIVVAGAEKLQPKAREAFERKFNKTIYEGFGTTETTPVASVNIPDAMDTTFWRIQHGNRPGTVGMPLPGSCFRIVDPDTLETLPLGEDGLILISGTQVMLGYLNDEEKTRNAIVELDGRRWYKTGDKGHLTTEGFLMIVDRYSRFAKIGGEMVSLGAVEEKVCEILGNDEINLVASTIPDEKKGEKIVLLIEGEDDADTVRKQLIDAKMDTLMLPSTVFKVETVPKLGTGKTDYSRVAKLVDESRGVTAK